MAKSKSSGRKQNSTGTQPSRKTARNAVRNPVIKKALSAKTGGTRKPKGPAAKKPTREKGSPTTAPSKGPRNASKPSGKKAAVGGTSSKSASGGKKAAAGGKKAATGKAAGGGRSTDKQPSTTARRPGTGRRATRATTAAPAATRKRRVGGQAFPPPAPSPESGMNVGSVSPEVQDMETSRQTVPPSQPAEDVIDTDVDEDVESGDATSNDDTDTSA